MRTFHFAITQELKALFGAALCFHFWHFGLLKEWLKECLGMPFRRITQKIVYSVLLSVAPAFTSAGFASAGFSLPFFGGTFFAGASTITI